MGLGRGTLVMDQDENRFLNMDQLMRHALVLAILAMAGLGGCRLGGSVSTETALNQLRSENAELKAKLAAVQGERTELLTKLERLQQGKSGVDTEALAALPVCTHVDIGSLSGPREDGTLDLLVRTLDGRDRFVQVAATMTAGVSRGPIPPLRFEPAAVREMYRSGALGTYYLLEFPASRWAPGDLIVVDVLDHATGQSHRVEYNAPEKK